MNKYHLHQYERSKSNEEIYRCVHPRCTHYQKKEFLIGKEAICNLCHKAFIMDNDQLRNKKPRCPMCQDTAKGRAFRKSMETIKGILQEAPPTIEDDFQPLPGGEEEKN